MSELLDIPLALVINLDSCTNSIVIVMLQKQVINRGKEKIEGTLGKWKAEGNEPNALARGCLGWKVL